MSGDVQPRKRKDKKRKKDELGLEESRAPEFRGTAAVLGEGDVFIHSQHDHGTGGHWCAKIIFFSLLAVLITLIGLIIIENRGLTDLDASTVESRYSGVLEGWLEDAPDDDHHDEHTLELNHPDGHDDEDDAETNEEFDMDDEDEDDNEGASQEDQQYYENNEIESNEEEDDILNNDDGDEQGDDELDNEDDNDIGDNDDESYEEDLENYNLDNDDDDDDDNSINAGSDEDEIPEDVDDENEERESDEYFKDIEDAEDDHDDEDEHEEPDDEIEHIEREAVDEEPFSTELPALPEEDDEHDNIDENNDIDDDDDESLENDGFEDEKTDDDDDFLEHEDDDDNDIESHIVERVTAPAGKPFMEVEDSTEDLPVDTLADEDEYEKRQEELRREAAEASHVWLKLGVGAALLLATHAVVRRATRHDESHDAESMAREESPDVGDRHVTLISNEEPQATAQKTTTYTSPTKNVLEEVKKSPILIQTTRPTLDDDESEIDEEPEMSEVLEKIEHKSDTRKHENSDKELCSDEDEVEEEETKEIELEAPKQSVHQKPAEKEDEGRNVIDSEDVPDDVEIIDEDQIEEELEEEEEEDISDVDDEELLTRLEAKYGRLPEPERFGFGEKHKDGGNSLDDLWPDEPTEPYWRQQLDQAEQHLNESAATAATRGALAGSARARWVEARALHSLAEYRRDNTLLARAIAAYMRLLQMSERLSDARLLQVAHLAVDRMYFRGNYLGAEPVYRLLIRRFPHEPAFRNNLTISYLMANRVDLATEVLNETLKVWPEDRVALVHYAFILKTRLNRLEEAVALFQKALSEERGPAAEARFFYHYGDALLQLGRVDEANKVHERGAELGFFLSPAQRSLYNVDRLKSKPWWNPEETPYKNLARTLEASWRDILREGTEAHALYEQEKEGLRERGEWSQLDLFVRGREVKGRCVRAAATCAAVRAEPAAAGCRRGQVKFSAMTPGTHVRAHVGPTNCRLRMHLALSNTDNTYIRVHNETRQWKVGKVLMFDDSFEHEVWHNGSAARLVLIVDVWHPDLTLHERRTLPAI